MSNKELIELLKSQLQQQQTQLAEQREESKKQMDAFLATLQTVSANSNSNVDTVNTGTTSLITGLNPGNYTLQVFDNITGYFDLQKNVFKYQILFFFDKLTLLREQ